MKTAINYSAKKEFNARVQRYFRHMFLSGDHIDTEEAGKGVEMLYQMCGLDTPAVCFADSPFGALRKAGELGDDTGAGSFDFAHGIDIRSFRALAAADVFKKEFFDDEDLTAYKAFLFSGVFMAIFLADYAIICRRPHRVTLDDNGLLHNDEGPAVRWRDGSELYFLHGTQVSKKMVEKKRTVFVTSIMAAERNGGLSFV
jgi:hypothetical protein